MPTSFNVISLGSLADIDLVEGDYVADNAAALVGSTFGGVGNALVDNFATFTAGTTGYAGGISSRYDQDNSPNEAFSIDGGVDQTFDSAARYNATITYIDGTTDTVEIVLLQDTDGNSYIAPDITVNANQVILEANPIRSLTLNSVSMDTTSGLVAERASFDYLTCFTKGALILTPSGQVPVEDLQVGDAVTTLDNGAQKIRWIGMATQPARDGLTPIRIKSGALGNDLQRNHVVVSQQHRMMVSSKIAERLTGSREVLVAANKLLCVKGVDLADDFEQVTYFHLLLDRHEIIYVEGAPTESLLTGPRALASIGQEALTEIEMLFPELIETAATPARFIVEKRVAIKMAYRHWKNDRPMIAA